jgi:hypothetical protein
MAENGSESAVRDLTVRRSVVGPAVLAVTTAALMCFSVQLVRAALAGPPAPLRVRGPLLSAAAALLILSLCIVVPPLRRKWQRGRFLMTRAEAAAQRAAYRSQMGAGKPFWPQARFWAIPCALVLMLASFGVFALAGALTPATARGGSQCCFCSLPPFFSCCPECSPSKPFAAKSSPAASCLHKRNWTRRVPSALGPNHCGKESGRLPYGASTHSFGQIWRSEASTATPQPV